MVTQRMLRTYERKKILSKKNIRFDTALDVYKCLKQII